MSALSRKVFVQWSVVLLCFIAGLGWRGPRCLAETSEKKEPAVDVSKKKFVTEEHWLVDETARDITEMLVFAAKQGGENLEFAATPQAGVREAFDLRASVHGTEIKASLQWKDYIWSPSEYAPWAQKLIAAFKLTPASPQKPNVEILQLLAVNPTPEGLIQTARNISASLTKNPLDAGAHEEAALVTAAFALREAAGNYSDNRRELCRISAHLAIAQALQPQSTSPIRQVARAALETLAGRETPALAAIDEMEHSTAPGIAPWARALRARNTGDWRASDSGLSLFEELELFGARCRSVSPEFALYWIEGRKPARIHAWRHMIFEGEFSVERGHHFAMDGVEQETRTVKEDWQLFYGQALPETDLVKALNQPAEPVVGKLPDGTPGIKVLGWDMWSAQHQHHLCAAIETRIRFMRDQWGVPQYRGVQQEFRRQFQDMTLLPLVERELTENPADLTEIGRRVSALLASHVEIVPPDAWGMLLQPAENVPPLAIESPQPWLRPQVPFGTAYDVSARLRTIRFPGKEERGLWETIFRLAPSNYETVPARMWFWSSGQKPSPAAVATAYAPIANYHLGAMQQIARSQIGEPEKFGETMQKICELDSEHYFELGAYYVTQNLPERAAEAYQKGVDRCTNRVLVANGCDWLVNYLDDHGQADKALQIATDAAKVYSYAGLETFARLKEKHGDLEEAHRFFLKIANRYDDDNPLDSFYVRNREKNADYKETAERLIRDVFPGGLEKADLASLQKSPGDGAVVTASSPGAVAAGLQANDVIVAVDGHRVHSAKQYNFAQGMTSDSKSKLIVWNPKGYREVVVNFPGRLEANIEDYHKD